MKGKILTKNLLNNETSNTESVKNEIVNSLDKLRVITKINNYISGINILNNDKMFKDIVEIIHKNIKVDCPKYIKIHKRIYSGKYSKGHIFNENIELKVIRNKAIAKLYIEFCISEYLNERATLEATIPFIFNNEELDELNRILDDIENNYKVNNAGEKIPIPEYLKYTDVSINDVNYSIKTKDEILNKLKRLTKYNSMAQAISEAYKSLIK